MVKAGAVYDVSIMIDMAHEYEKVHQNIPNKEIGTMFQTASFTPKLSSVDAQKQEEQLKSMKRDQMSHKSMEQKMDTLFQVLAANFKPRG